MNVTFFGKWLLQFDPAQDGQFVGFNVGMLPVIDGLSAVMTDNDASKLVFIVYMVEGDRSRIILQSDQTLAFLSILPTAPGSYHVLGSIIPTPATALQPEGADVLTINETSPLQEGTYIQLQYLDWTMVWQGNFGPNTIQLLLVPPNPRFPPLPLPALRMTYRTHSLETILSSKNAQGYDLAHVILRGVDLSGCNFSNALFNGADLSGANLSNCDCSGAEFQGANLTNTVFTDANLNYSDFTGATIAGMDLRSSSLSPTGTQLVATNFTGLNVTPVHFDPVPHFSRDHNQRTIFTNATIPYSVLGHNWSCLDLRGVLVPDLPQTLSDQDHPLQARDSLLTYFQKGSLINKSLQYSDFSNSDLSSLDLSGCDFSYANLTQTLFSGANLTAATLRNVNAQGVQFGSLTRLFHLDLSLQSALNAGDFSVLAPVFKLNGRSLSASITIKKVRALWSITDGPRTLAVTKSTIDDNVQIAIQTATPVIVDSQLFPDFEASLDTLNRKEIARVLTNYGVTLPDGFGAELRTALWRMEDTGASTTYVIRQDIPSRGPAVIHVYGSGAGANLADVYMPNAMLDNANFSDVTAPNIQLYGDSASLNGATLEDADFSGANLGGMSLKQVQMQGIILDRAILVNARLNAAVLTPSVKGRAASLTNANLQGADFTDALLFGANLADAAVAVQLDPADSAQGGGVYQFSLDSSYSDTFNQAAQSDSSALQKLKTVFGHHRIELRAKATVGVLTAGNVWGLDNDSQNATDPQPGCYVQFQIRLDPVRHKLDVYGTSINIERLLKNQTEIDNENCAITILPRSSLSDTTTCPNHYLVSTNAANDPDQSRWMRAPGPPPPPTCVPNDQSYCPPPASIRMGVLRKNIIADPQPKQKP